MKKFSEAVPEPLEVLSEECRRHGMEAFAVKAFEKHYNSERNHQAVENQIIRPDPQVFEGQGAVHCVEHLGGLLKFYRREAA